MNWIPFDIIHVYIVWSLSWGIGTLCGTFSAGVTFPWLFGGFLKKKLHTHYYQMSIQNINLTMHHCLFNFTSDTLHHEKSVQIPLSNFTYFLTEAEILFKSVFWRDCRKSRISLIKKWTNLLLISFIVRK